MTPEQKIKREILLQAVEREDLTYIGEVTEENVDRLYQDLCNDEVNYDYESEFREGDFETDVEPDFNRNYESKSVAKKMVDGTWVGWTYWYGGGKHGQPESIEWMQHAYDLDVTEEEKTVIWRTFNRRVNE